MASALSAEDDIRIVGQPHSIEQLLHGLENFRPHVLVLSSSFLSQIDAIRQTCERRQTAILMLEDRGDGIFSQPMPNVHGVMQRSETGVTIVRYVRQLAQGNTVPPMVRDSGSEMKADAVGVRVWQQLTAQELRIIAFVVQGFKNREIASHMGVTEASIKNSLRRIFDKTGVFDRLELALFVVHHRALKPTASGTVPWPALKSLGTAQPDWRMPRGTVVN